MDQQEQFKIPANFSLTPIKSSQIPPENVLIRDAQALLVASVSWQAGKTYQQAQTFVHNEYNEDTKTSHTWHCIVTECHKDEVSFNKFWSKLGRNKTWNQKSYLDGIAKVTRVKYISEWQSIWTILYIHPPPMSPRVYTMYQASWLLEYSHRRRGIVITLPVDLALGSTRNLTELEEKGVKGRYVCVEHLREIGGDMIERRMVACLEPGGLIPKFWAQKNMAKRMVEESVACKEWLKNLRPEDTREDSGEEEIPQRHNTSREEAHRELEELEEVDYRDSDTNTGTTTE